MLRWNPISAGLLSLMVSVVFSAFCTAETVEKVTNPLQGYWSFDDPSAPGADLSGNGNTVIFTGTSASLLSEETPFGKGMSFTNSEPNTSASVTFADPLSMDAYTVSYWIKAENPTKAYNAIGANGGWGAYWSHCYSDGNFYVGPAGNSRLTLQNVYNAGEWTHYAYSYDNGAVKVYKNGEQIASGNLPSSTAWNSFVLAKAHNTDYLNGSLDDAAIWGTALNANEVKLLASGKADPGQLSVLSNASVNALNADTLSLTSPTDVYAYTVLQDDPVGYWRMNDAPGSTTFKDATGNGNDLGSIKNAVLQGGRTLSENPCPLFNAGGMNFGGTFESALSSDIAMKDGFSVEYWIEPENFDANFQIGVLEDDSQTSNWDHGFTMHTYNKKGEFYLGTNISQRITPNDYEQALEVDNWNHVVFTFNGEEGSLFLNGELAVSKKMGQSVNWDDLWVENIDGLFSDLAVYEYALSADQIMEHYLVGSTAPSVPEPAAWVLLLTGAFGVGAVSQRKRKKNL